MLELVFDSTGMVLTKGAYPTTDNGRPQAWLEDLAQRGRPVTLAGEQLLPVPRAPEPLLPDRGLHRVGAGWPIPPDIRLAVTASQWEGLGQGDGRLEARKVEVAAAGRGAAVLERRAKLWLPSPDAQQGAGPRHDRYVRAVEEEMDSRVVRPWKGREVDTTSAASKGRLLQSV